MRPIFVVASVLALLAACQPTGGPSRPAGSSGTTSSEAATPLPVPTAPAQAGSAAPAHSSAVERLIAAARQAGETELVVSWSDNSLGGFEGAQRFEALLNSLQVTTAANTVTLSFSVSDTDLERLMRPKRATRRAAR